MKQHIERFIKNKKMRRKIGKSLIDKRKNDMKFFSEKIGRNPTYEFVINGHYSCSGNFWNEIDLIYLGLGFDVINSLCKGTDNDDKRKFTVIYNYMDHIMKYMGTKKCYGDCINDRYFKFYECDNTKYDFDGYLKNLFINGFNTEFIELYNKYKEIYSSIINYDIAYYCHCFQTKKEYFKSEQDLIDTLEFAKNYDKLDTIYHEICNNYINSGGFKTIIQYSNVKLLPEKYLEIVKKNNYQYKITPKTLDEFMWSYSYNTISEEIINTSFDDYVINTKKYNHLKFINIGELPNKFNEWEISYEKCGCVKFFRNTYENVSDRGLSMGTVYYYKTYNNFCNNMHENSSNQ